jgi:GNAT superfamily N-acetyltransferase
MGMRPVDTLARGHHLHVDDLVVDAAHRNARIGEALMAFAERWAVEHGCTSVFLDARAEALRFYSRLGYAPHTATLVRKRIEPA